MMTSEQRLRYVVNAAESALPVWETAYPKRRKVREAVAAVKALLLTPTPETRASVHNLNHSIADMGYWAEDNSASHAAYTVHWAVSYADLSTRCESATRGIITCAAYAVDNASCASLNWSPLLEYGIELLEG